MYQAPYNSSHYPNQYSSNTQAVSPQNVVQTSSLSYYPSFSITQHSGPPPPREPIPPRAEPAVSPSVASKTINLFISSQLLYAGFGTAPLPAVQRLELELVAFIEQLFERTHEYANLANRTGAIPTDLLAACEDFDLPTSELHPLLRRAENRKKRKSKRALKQLTLVPPPSPPQSPELLPSDDEGVPPVMPTTLRGLPSYFPDLPPKHTYLQTPASPPKKAALPSLEKKLKTAGLVQESLQNLLLATEDSNNQEDGELLGHIVNWEMSTHPRKRWKIGS